MRTLKIIHHDKLSRICTINVHHICKLSILKSYENSKVSYINIFWGNGASTDIQLLTEKAYKLYDKLAQWLSNEVTDLEVELINGMDGDAIDYIAVEK